AALGQVRDDGTEQILEYASRRLNDTQVKWQVKEKELFAIRWAVERWLDYLKPAGAEVRTDHLNLTYNFDVTNPKMLKRITWLQRLQLTSVRIKGRDNVLADWQSRHPVDEVDDEEDDWDAVAFVPRRKVYAMHVAPLPSSVPSDITSG